MEITFDTEAFSKALEEKREQLNKATRPAAQAAAEILERAAKMRAPVSEHAHFFYGTSYKKTGQRYLFRPGTLRDSIYQVFSKDNSSPTVSTYHVAWNHQKAPYGFMVEFGTSRAPAHPFLGPAIKENQRLALEVMEDVFLQNTK